MVKAEQLLKADTADKQEVKRIDEIERGRIIDLGLRGGVDARPVTMDNIIGTDDGGCLQMYDREVCLDKLGVTHNRSRRCVLSKRCRVVGT